MLIMMKKIRTHGFKAAVLWKLIFRSRTSLPHAACVLALAVLHGLPLHAQTDSAKSARVFRAGASLSNITPPLGEGIVGNFGTPPPAKHIHDQLHVRSLVLDDGETRLVFAIADNVGIKREVFDEAKQLINKATGLAKEHMLMSATHTHSAISAGGTGVKRMGWAGTQPLDDYQQFIARRIADGVMVAINNLQPARIGWGQGRYHSICLTGGGR